MILLYNFMYFFVLFTNCARNLTKTKLTKNDDAMTYEMTRHLYPFPENKIVKKSFQKDYYVKQEIGRGGFGVCKIVQLHKSHTFFVAKVINKIISTDNSMSYLFNEIRLQGNLKHKNIVSLEKVYVGNGTFTLITEFCFYGCLQDMVDKKRNILEEGVKRHIIHGILCGARYLHNKSIVHGDIKPLNIFISKWLEPKLGDFGMAHYEDQEEYFGGTLNYFAPEMFRIKDERHTKKTDVWAIGCTAYYTYTGEHLFKQSTNDRTPQVRRQISGNRRHEGWISLPVEVRSFINLMTNKDPLQRPDCSSLIRHPFVMRRHKRAFPNNVLHELQPCIINPY